MRALLLPSLLLVACLAGDPSPGTLGPCSVFKACPSADQVCVYGGCALATDFLEVGCDGDTQCPDTLICGGDLFESGPYSWGTCAFACPCPQGFTCQNFEQTGTCEKTDSNGNTSSYTCTLSEEFCVR
jgi:hypothetical protein